MIDELLATLERQSGAEIAQIRADGQARAAELTAASERRIAERRAATLGRRETEAHARHERELSRIRHAARARVLEARAALLERVFEQLRRALPSVATSSAYRAGLAARLRRLRAYSGETPVTIECMPALAAALRRLVKTNGDLRIRGDRHIAAGFRLVTTNGRVEIDARLDTLLERRRPRLALEALAALTT